jgi:fibronectin type 3 domain-containing protein
VGSVDPLIESAPSNEACVEVRDIVPPAPPGGLAVVPRDGALEVVWSPSPDVGLATYRVYRAAAGAEAERVAEIPAGTTTWVDTTGEGGVLYRYTVTAVDAAGNEGPSSGSAEGIRQ